MTYEYVRINKNKEDLKKNIYYTFVTYAQGETFIYAKDNKVTSHRKETDDELRLKHKNFYITYA